MSSETLHRATDKSRDPDRARILQKVGGWIAGSEELRTPGKQGPQNELTRGYKDSWRFEVAITAPVWV